MLSGRLPEGEESAEGIKTRAKGQTVLLDTFDLAEAADAHRALEAEETKGSTVLLP